MNSNFDTIWTKEYPSIEQRNFPSFGKIIKTKSGHICMVGVDNQNNSENIRDWARRIQNGNVTFFYNRFARYLRTGTLLELNFGQ